MRKGRGKSFQDSINMAKNFGQDGDTILAHINPTEANELGKKYGYDINPYTGLPQYGLKFRHIFKPIQKILQSRPMQKIIPIVAGAVGQIVGGPGGAAIGSGVGRAITHRQNIAKSLLQGGLKGGAIGAGASMLGGLAGSPMLMGGQGFQGIGMGGPNPQNGMMGTVFGNGPGSMAQGLGNFGGSLLGRGAQSSPGEEALYQNNQPGGLNSLISGGGSGGILSSLGGPLGLGLLGAGIAGTLKGRERVTPAAREQERQQIQDVRNLPINELSSTNYDRWGPQYQPKRVKPLKRKFNPNFNPLEDKEHEYFEETNPEVEYYAQGGYVYGPDGGQLDNRNRRIPEGSYVMNATDVSLLGDGNSNKGAKELIEMERNLFRSGLSKAPSLTRGYEQRHSIPAKLSDGEYVIEPQYVTAIGNGNNSLGAKKLNNARKALRKQKGVKSILPPKSKPMTSYMR